MTAIEHPTLPREPFTRALDRVNLWRGRCQDALARAEAAVTETLFALAQVPGRGAGIDLPHLVGQRHEALHAALAKGGAFAAEGGAVLPALERLRTFDRLRTALGHGIGKVSLDTRGEWTLVLRIATLRARQVCRDTVVYQEREAAQLLDELVQLSHKLSAQLGQVRAAAGG